MKKQTESVPLPDSDDDDIILPDDKTNPYTQPTQEESKSQK